MLHHNVIQHPREAAETLRVTQKENTTSGFSKMLVSFQNLAHQPLLLKMQMFTFELVRLGVFLQHQGEVVHHFRLRFLSSN